MNGKNTDTGDDDIALPVSFYLAMSQATERDLEFFLLGAWTDGCAVSCLGHGCGCCWSTNGRGVGQAWQIGTGHGCLNATR